MRMQLVCRALVRASTNLPEGRNKGSTPSHVDRNEFDHLKTDRKDGFLLTLKGGSETRDSDKRLKYDG